MDLSTGDVKQLNDFTGFLKFKYTWAYKRYIHAVQKFLLLITGNQFGKTGSVAHSYVLRILGFHPVAQKNVVYYECENQHAYAPYLLPQDNICGKCGKLLKLHERSSRVIRFCAETLPGQSASINEEGRSAEVKNTQYPELKKWLPPFLIKKDITARNVTMIIKDIYGGDDIVIEFVSYNQSTQSVAGQQRLSVWCDESPSIDFYQEQLPRLVAEDGDIVFTYTPVDRSSWLFDELFEKAKVVYRTRAIIEYLKKTSSEREYKEVEETDSKYDVAVIQAATDDNPTLKPEAIDALFQFDDPDTLAIRRYGVFKQLSGRIFKDFDTRVHVVDPMVYFPDGLPHEWAHARGIDYHPQTSWACGMIGLSPTNEAYIWGELNISPERYTTAEIVHALASIGKDYNFRLNLIDPLAEAIKKDTVSVKDDLNHAMIRCKRDGVGLGGYFQSWDTKGERGRDVIRQRLKNAVACRKPGNNRVVKDGVVSYLPTLWVLQDCRFSIEYMKNWRWEEWADVNSSSMKDKKNTPEQKFSHFNMVWEAIFKEPSFKPPVERDWHSREDNYFKRR